MKRDNLLVLFDDTEYITKDDYEGPGSTGSVTYCDYALKGGDGKLFSQGTVKDIQWKVRKHKLILIDEDATEAAQQEAEAKATEEGKTPEEIQAAVDSAVVYASLNQGKTWIGWVSDNNGGELEISPNEPKEEPADDAEGADGAEDGGDTTETEAE